MISNFAENEREQWYIDMHECIKPIDMTQLFGSLLLFPPFCNRGIFVTRYKIHMGLIVKLVHYRGGNSLLGTKGGGRLGEEIHFKE